MLLCYCGTAHRCHRAILRGSILPTLGAVDCGELPAPATARVPPTAATAGLLDLAQGLSGPRAEEEDECSQT